MKESVDNDMRQLREKRGESQVELAEVLGVSRQTVIAIEKGNYTPSVLLAMKIAKHFNSAVEKVFSIKK